jgi:hypothetical protein
VSESTQRKRSIFTLIADIPGLLVELIKAELQQLKDEMAAKLKAAGIGIGLFVGAALFGFFALAVLITTAILGIAVALPGWLAALIVGVALLVITGILAALGTSSVKKGVPPAPTETIKSVKKDVHAIKGIGKRGTT